MIEQHLLGHERGREHREPAHGRDRADARRQRALRLLEALRVPLRRRGRLDEDVAARAPGVAGDRRDRVDQEGYECRVRNLLDSEVEHDGSGVRRRQLLGRLHDLRGIESAAPRHLRDVDVGQRTAQCLEVACSLLHELRVDPALGRRERRRNAEQQEGVGTGTHPQVPVGLAGGLGLPGIDHDHAAVGILGQLPEGVVRVVAAVADARVRAHHEQEARVLEIGVEEGGGRRVEHPLVHQEVLRFLLGQRVEPALRAEVGEKGEAVGGVHVVGLPADPHQADRPWRMLLPDRAEPVRDLGDRRLPGHPLESAALAPAQWVLDALGVVDVVADRERLVADVTARDGVGLVGADSGDASAFDVDADAAVVAAEHTDAGQVVRRQRQGRLRDREIDALRGGGHGGSSWGLGVRSGSFRR
jgi:hypothetical protein